MNFGLIIIFLMNNN